MADDLLGLIHSDVCGPISYIARGGYQYFITFIDDYSRYGYLYMMKHKDESFIKFKTFKNEVQNQLGKSSKALRTYQGGEYLSQEFDDYLKDCGIVSQLTPLRTPQWNGVSEHRNRTLLDMVQSMMSQSDLPISFCGYAIETATFVLNHVPSKSVQKTPYDIWTRKPPSLSFLKIWGYEAYVKRHISNKLATKSDKCLFVRYPKKQKDTTSIIVQRTKCLLLKMLSFWKERTYQKELVGVKFSLKKFEHHKEALNRLWKLNRFHKMLLNLHK